MNQKKLNRIENELIASIQYARLQYDLSKIKNDNLEYEASEKKKKINNDNLEDDVFKKKKTEIENDLKQVEKDFKLKVYNMYNGERFTKLLNLLTKDKEGVLVKNQIALKIVLLKNCKDINDDFMLDLSNKLFNDSTEVQNLFQEYKAIYDRIFQDFECQDSKEDDETRNIQKPTSRIGKITAFFSGVLKVGKSIFTHTPKENPLQEKRTSEIEEFASMLCFFVLGMSKMKQQLKNEQVKFKKYFTSKMKVVNKTKEKITNCVFIKWYDKNNNYKKLKLLQRFDDIIYELITTEED